MARHFVRLKLSLLAGGLKRGWQQAVGLVGAAIVGLPAGVTLFFLLMIVGRRTSFGPTALIAVFALFALGWTVGPVLFFGMDETLDPARLRLLPLSRRQLASGMLAASAIGVGPAMTVLALCGAIAGFAPAGPGAVLVVAGVLLHAALCLVLGRALTTALSRRLRSRKGRDILATAGALVGLSFAALGQLPNILQSRFGDAQAIEAFVVSAARAVSWLPPIWPARAILAAADGGLLAAVGWLLLSAALILALAWWWMTTLERSLGEPGTQTQAADDDEDLFPRWVRWLPRDRLGAAVAKELRYLIRMPQLRAQWIGLPILAVAPIVVALFLPQARRPELVLAPAALALLQGLVGLNAFAGDRKAIWLLVATSRVERTDIAAKNVATGLVLLPAVLASALVLAAITSGWGYVPVTLAAAASLFGVEAAVGNISSLLAPAPLSASETNVFSTNAGMGCSTALLQMVAFMVVGVLCLPVIGAGAAAFALRPGLVPVVAVAAMVHGLGCWALGLRMASGIAADRGPELLIALSTER